MKRKLIEFMNKANVTIKVCDLALKPGGKDFEKYNAYNFPDETLLITNLVKNGEKLLYLTFFCKKLGYTQVIVPKDLKVNKIIGKARNKVINEYDDFIVKNLRYKRAHYFYVGSDPEIFIEDKKGKIIPAFEFLGSKEKPDISPKAKDRTPMEAGNKPMYWDGFQAEFVTHAASCLAWQIDSVQLGLEGLINKARAKYPDAKLSSQTVMDIPFELLRSSKDEHVEFGCMPSQNAYGLEGLKGSGREVPFRSAGGHIHFGIGKKTKAQHVKIVKALDAILGVACVAFFAKYDNPKRRQMYGLAGEYRTPPHGLEYRPLSNAWMFHPLIMNIVFDLGRKAVMFGENNLMKHWKATEKETIECINKCDASLAKKILDRNKTIVLNLLYAAYGHLNEDGVMVIFNAIKNGMETIVKDPTDIEGNWNLNTNWISHCEGPEKNVTRSISVLLNGKKVA